MASPVELEAPPRASIDTVVGERPQSPKIEPGPAEPRAPYESVFPTGIGNTAPGSLASPTTEVYRPLRSENIPRDQRIEWENIRSQLGLSDVEEGRVDWEPPRPSIAQRVFADHDEDSGVGLLKQLGEACLVLLTSPFMLLHGVFKMSGAFCRNLGLIFTALGMLCKKLTYKPKKNKNPSEPEGKVPSTAAVDNKVPSEETPVDPQQELEWKSSLRNLEHVMNTYKSREGPASERDVEQVAEAMEHVAASHTDPVVKKHWRERAKAFRMASDDERDGILTEIGKGFLMLLTTPFFLVGAVLQAAGGILNGFGSILKGLGRLTRKLTYTGSSKKSKEEDPVSIEMSMKLRRATTFTHFLCPDEDQKPDSGSAVDDPPPPYTVGDPGEPSSEVQEPAATALSPPSQFCRFGASQNTKDRVWSTENQTAEDGVMDLKSPGLKEIEDGGRQIVDSAMYFAETSLEAAGGVLEGLGKIIAGLGKAVGYRRKDLLRRGN
ncbi:hypothetical protein NP233_g225 [Leucocoprinus birnbaumii]|uniref:Uncharacterized protein n=1 Tax=Leucocoprinus birnbaumii TaxID=56174 RepID=A0AAD5YWW6_9AGAR|nr:hypothetical protein NP233_g225 [Leucocoprinus birnbaumii]